MLPKQEDWVLIPENLQPQHSSAPWEFFMEVRVLSCKRQTDRLLSLTPFLQDWIIRIGPFHAHLFKEKRAEFFSINDDEALQSAFELTKQEGIIPALESSHALAVLDKKKFNENDIVVICLSGRGDKDMETYLKNL